MLTQLFLVLLILVTVGLNAIAQTLLKLGSGQNALNFYLLGGLLLYGLGAVSYILVLGKSNLSIAYPVVIGLTAIAVTALGAFFLKEKVTTIQAIGIGLMLSGIWAISVGKS
jgi:multidrug transporter EmrE-like cation transporter